MNVVVLADRTNGCAYATGGLLKFKSRVSSLETRLSSLRIRVSKINDLDLCLEVV